MLLIFTSMNKLLCILLLFLGQTLFAQKNIKNADGETLGYFKENVLLDFQHQVLYNIKGQIVFDKLSENRNDIILTIDLKKNKTVVYNGIETSPHIIITKNEIYWRKNREDVLVAKLEVKNGFTSFYSPITDSLIAYVDSESLSGLELGLGFFYVWNALELESKIPEKKLGNSSTELPEGILGFMKPVFGDPLNVWLWDGTYFYPAYDRDPRYVWLFDGKTIKPDFNSRIETEWSWDGEELKPFWGGHPRNNWRWEGNIFRQVFENNYRNEFEIVDGIARKRFGSYGDIEWEIHGHVPLALVSIVLLRIVYR